MSGNLKMIALAGAEEIGMNMTVYTYEKENGEKYSILVDCGVGFVSLPGAAIAMPDLNALKDLDVKIEAIIITHGHEDHIGALPYLSDFLNAPIYATPFTMGLIERKFSYIKTKKYKIEGLNYSFLTEQNINKEKKLFTVKAGESRQFGPFKITWIHCTHSVPDSSMLGIELENGIRLVHTGDWKDDTNPVVGKSTDFALLSEFSKKGVHALIADSTNIHEESEAITEATVGESIAKLVKETKTGKIVFTCFASNIARVKSCVEAARLANRKVLVLGSSLEKSIDVALSLGYMMDDIIIDESEVKNYRPNELMIISTGSQAEERSALWKMAHKDLQAGSVLEKGDTVVFSARVIDGRQADVRKVINLLVERGVRIIHPWNSHDSCIHASGHPTRPDIKKLLNTVKPNVVVPVHCEAEHRISHIAFAKELGFKAFNLRNGTIAEIKKDEIVKVGNVRAGKIALDGLRLLNFESDVFTKRKEMNENGFIMVTIRIKGKEASNILVSDYGVFDSFDRDSKKEGISSVKNIVNSVVAGVGINLSEKEGLRKKIVNSVKDVVWKKINKNPVVGVHFTL